MRGSSGSHSCGGSIISKQFVMTAAHCTDGRKASDLSVQYGVTKINATGPNVVRVKKIIQHEDYNPYNNYANDISLLLVEEPFEFDGVTVAPVKLPELAFATPQTDAGGEECSSDGDSMRLVFIHLIFCVQGSNPGVNIFRLADTSNPHCRRWN